MTEGGVKPGNVVLVPLQGTGGVALFALHFAKLFGAKEMARALSGRDDFLAMARAIESSGLKPVIDSVFAFEELREAMDYLKSGQHFGKVCIRHCVLGQDARPGRASQSCTASMLAMPAPAAW